VGEDNKPSIQINGDGAVATKGGVAAGKGGYAAGRDIIIHKPPTKPLPTPRQALAPPVHFTGRENTIKELKKMLIEKTDETVTVLCGMGGVGKTTLAQKIACDLDIEQHYPDGTFWVDLQSIDTISALKGFAHAYGYDICEFTEINTLAGAVRSILREKKIFIVLDNAWREEEIKPLLPHSSKSCVLITTRDEGLARLLTEEVVSVDVLSEEESIALIEKVIGKEIVKKEKDLALELVSLLGYLPLAVELAAKLVKQELGKSWGRFQDVVDNLKMDEGRLDLGLKDKQLRSIFNASYSRALDDNTRNLFQWLSIFQPSDMELGAIMGVWNIQKKDTVKYLNIMRDLSLIQQTGRTLYRFHSLIYDFACEKLEEQNDSVQVAIAHKTAADWFLREPIDPNNVISWDNGLYHLRRAAEVSQNDEYFQAYKNFVFESSRSLNWYGWGRRILQELIMLDKLAKEDFDLYIINYHIALQLEKLGEISEAISILKEFNKYLPKIEEPFSEENMDIIKMVLLIKTRLGKMLARHEHILEAQRLVDEIEPLIDFLEDDHIKKSYLELRFEIVRKSEEPDPHQMLRLAKEHIQMMEKEFKNSPSPETLNSLSSSHFNLGVSYIRLNEPNKAFQHFIEQLRIKVEIGNLPGIASGLLNIAAGIQSFDITTSGALLLTWDQIVFEIEEKVEEGMKLLAEPLIIEFLNDRKNFDDGKEIINNISNKILPYYERALERRT
jgi:tetratricopeptide (TPR) repeat protein